MRRRLLAFGSALAVFLFVAMIAGTYIHVHLVGWVGVLPAAFTFNRVSKILDSRDDRRLR
jgi:4-hydroxybenzoate polyprenyltransferase